MNRRKTYGAIAILLLPGLILYTIAFIYPAIQTIYQSFFDWNGIFNVPLTFDGLNNYREMLDNPNFYKSLKNVGLFIAGSFILILPIALTLALVVTSRMRGKRFFKVAFFIPSILPLTAVGLMWQFLLKSDGLVNKLLDMVGLSGLTHDWLGEPALAIYTVVIVNAWIYCGQNMIILSSGLVSIPDDIYEAASLDGANGFQKLYAITIPLMKETFKVFAVLAITQSIRVFGQVYVISGGGPNGATDVPTTLLYNEAFKFNNFGVGNSIGTFMIVAALVITVVMNFLTSPNKRSKKRGVKQA
ncbi:carbohydrate ABC transporter permease [Paenibacillus pini]|uniref:Sugar ABC transporter permease n=1 Tax=Paenibacillus pini JCM 16418 TaxID=1236976 RepID=W7YC76_9BACL|nr:sugar ABC transporter permease [Paenibacillus pini]GAF08515.1 sugar ABC transporter permease [Paenibacillus pini JCM 16418]